MRRRFATVTALIALVAGVLGLTGSVSQAAGTLTLSASSVGRGETLRVTASGCSEDADIQVWLVSGGRLAALGRMVSSPNRFDLTVAG